VAPLYLMLCYSSSLASVCAHVNYQCATASAMASSALTCADYKPAAIRPLKKSPKQIYQTPMWRKMMMRNNFCGIHALVYVLIELVELFL